VKWEEVRNEGGSWSVVGRPELISLTDDNRQGRYAPTRSEGGGRTQTRWILSDVVCPWNELRRVCAVL